MNELIYKGIVFDDFEIDEDGVWAEICQECAEKYFNKIKGEIDDGNTARGCCSVKGCTCSGDDDERRHYYIDFIPEKIKLRKACD